MNFPDMDNVIALALTATKSSIERTQAREQELSVLTQRGDYTALRDALQQYIHEAEVLQAHLHDVEAKG